MQESDFEELPSAAVFQALKRLDEQGTTVESAQLMAETEGDPVAEDLVPLLLMSEPEREAGEALDDAIAVAESCFNALRLMNLDRRIHAIGLEVASAERAGDTERRDQLALEQLELTKQRTALFQPKNEAA
jgi:hypothetical protein